MVQTRLGDGSTIEMTEEEIRADIERGVEDATDRANIDSLSEDEIDRLADIYTRPNKFVSVETGNELVLTFDEGSVKLKRLAVSIGRIPDLQLYERAFCSDTAEMAHIDYSYKPIKPIIAEEQIEMEQALLTTVLPVFYGAMPNLSLYSQPDGSFPNPAELLPKGKIKEAQEAYEGMVEHAISDMVFVASKMYEAGADGINFDTTGSAGEPDFLATLRATEILKEKYPDISIEMGMSGEFVLGMHGEIEYDGVNLAGLYPHEQVKLAEKAGADIFGGVVNINSSETIPWNIGRTVTMMKACAEVANIPVHANVGMGVGGVPIVETPPVDSLSRASAALAEVGKLDGL